MHVAYQDYCEDSRKNITPFQSFVHYFQVSWRRVLCYSNQWLIRSNDFLEIFQIDFRVIIYRQALAKRSIRGVSNTHLKMMYN